MAHKKKIKQKIVVGLTGSFGSGKTTVARIFSLEGAQVVDADAIAHSLYIPRTAAYRAIVNTFGKTILTRDARIDRRKLAGIVFGKKSLLKKLNAIMHPAIIKIIKKKVSGARRGVIVLDAPLLLEAGLKDLVDKLIVVKITRDRQITRTRKKTKLTKTEIIKRIAQQIPLKEKLRAADFIIDNNGSVVATTKQAQQVWNKLECPGS